MASQDASSPQFVPVSSCDDGFRVVSERVLHSRYVTLYDRTVEFPSDKKQQDAAPLRFDYDVLGHPRAGFHFVSIFPFHSAGDEPSCTVVREYGQVSQRHRTAGACHVSPTAPPHTAFPPRRDPTTWCCRCLQARWTPRSTTACSPPLWLS